MQLFRVLLEGAPLGITTSTTIHMLGLEQESHMTSKDQFVGIPTTDHHKKEDLREFCSVYDVFVCSIVSSPDLPVLVLRKFQCTPLSTKVSAA